MERFERWADDVDSLQAAFGFIMDSVDNFPFPTIQISPYYPVKSLLEQVESDEPHDPLKDVRYTVTVSGHVE